MKSKSKRNSRTIGKTPTNRFTEQQSNEAESQKFSNEYRTNQLTAKEQRSKTKVQIDDDGSTLGVYMTMDELSELVKAVKENAKSRFDELVSYILCSIF
jgi:hypothetical protein